jgi:hypothetical protein
MAPRSKVMESFPTVTLLADATHATEAVYTD